MVWSIFLCNVRKWQDTCLLVEIQKKHEQLTKKEEGLAKLSSFFAAHLQKGIFLVNSHVLQTSPWLKITGQVRCVLIPCWYAEHYKFHFPVCAWSVCVWISQGFDQPPLIAFQLFWLLYSQTKAVITLHFFSSIHYPYKTRIVGIFSYRSRRVIFFIQFRVQHLLSV